MYHVTRSTSSLDLECPFLPTHDMLQQMVMEGETTTNPLLMGTQLCLLITYYDVANSKTVWSDFKSPVDIIMGCDLKESPLSLWSKPSDIPHVFQILLLLHTIMLLPNVDGPGRRLCFHPCFIRIAVTGCVRIRMGVWQGRIDSISVQVRIHIRPHRWDAKRKLIYPSIQHCFIL